MDNAHEEWMDVKGYEGLYKVSSLGRIRSVGRIVKHGNRFRIINDRILTGTKNKSGHIVVSLSNKCSHERLLVHRVVLSTFVGPCPDGMECCHWDGNHDNNRVENLRWDTRKSNCLDSIRHGTNVRGEKNHSSILSEFGVRVIRRLLEFGTMSQREIGEYFCVSKGTISDINMGKRWGWLNG